MKSILPSPGLISIAKTAEEKLNLLSDSARFDLSCSCSMNPTGRTHDPTDPLHRWIYPAALPDGSTAPILKILLTNYCVNNCRYCVVCTNRDNDAVSFEPEELARLFMLMVAKRLVRGIFISSATGHDAVKTMDKIIITAELLRLRYRFRGYIHLKVLPGASTAHIERAMQLGNRVSINLEAPNKKRLSSIAKGKDFDALMGGIQKIHSLIQEQDRKKVSQTTQFVVGAAQESDREILHTTRTLYKDYRMSRVYFSAFQPFDEKTREEMPAVPLVREHRLYQSDFLFRKYKFDVNEIQFDSTGNLPLEKDPKTLWAISHPELFPVEVNKADIWQLMRVPGIGPVSAKRLVNMRCSSRFHSLEELKHLGVRTANAKSFILINGRKCDDSRQLFFF